MRNLKILQQYGILSWTQSVAFNETEGCVASGFPDCSRAAGTFVTGGFLLREERVDKLCKDMHKRQCTAGRCQMVIPRGKPDPDECIRWGAPLAPRILAKLAVMRARNRSKY